MMAVSDLLNSKFKGETRTCETHGEYKSLKFGENWTSCGKCAEQKQKKEDEEKAAREQKEREKWWLEKRIGRAAIPERFLSRNFENYEATTPESEKALKIAYSYAEMFVDNEGASLIMHGKVGTGKTHLAISIANYLLKIGLQPVFTSVYKAMMTIKESYSKNSQMTEQEAINLFIQPDLLILDEVGVQFNSETEKMYLFEIINGRYEKMKSTILITNMNIEDLEKCIGTRVLDRLREGGGRAICFDWPSYRRKI